MDIRRKDNVINFMNPEKELKSNYYFSLVTNLLLIIIMSLCIIYLIIDRKSFEFDKIGEQILFYGILILIIICIVYFMYKFIICLKDYQKVRNNEFKEIVGTVYRYAKNETETGQQLNSHPIIKLLGRDETIELFVNKGTELNKTYTFMYLENTKIGVVKEEYVE